MSARHGAQNQPPTGISAGLAAELDRLGYATAQTPEVRAASSDVTGQLAQDVANRLTRYVLWYALVTVAVHAWTSLAVESVGTNFAVALAALWAILNPPTHFALAPTPKRIDDDARFQPAAD